MAIKEYRLAYQAKNYIPWQHRHYDNIYIHLGRLLIFMNNLYEAADVLHAGIKDYPDSSDIWFLEAINEDKIGDHTNAVRAAHQAVMLAPGDQILQSFYQKIKAGKST